MKQAFLNRLFKKIFKPKYYLYTNNEIKWVYKIEGFKVYVNQYRTWVRSGDYYFRFLLKVKDSSFYGSITEQEAFLELL